MLGGTGSGRAGVGGCGAWAQLPHGMWDLPGPGMEPMYPALSGRVFTIEPTGKPQLSIFLSFGFTNCKMV